MRMPMPGRSPLPFRRIWRKLKSMLRHVRQPLPGVPDYTVMTPVLFPFYGSAKARAFNARSIRRQVERVARRLGMRDPHIVVTVPTAWDVAMDMQRSSLVYNRSDKHSAFGEADQGLIAGLERQLLTHADAVLYSSRAFLESERELTGDRARFLDHGVDTVHFAARPRTGALSNRGIPRPIVGFFGGLDDYVIDFDLLDRIVTIRHAVGAGHVNLVETLAERIAAMCLEDRRVLSARVRIEKLDVFAEAESVGVEIERFQPRD